MPLVDLKTNLKSLKYGRDRLNGGSSNEPFVSKDIEGLRLSDLHRTGGSDLLIRGGFLLGDRIKDDVIRLGKYFTTTEGVLWSTTQNVLSETGVRIYGGYPEEFQLINGYRLNDGTYLPTSTLLQLPLGPFGSHLNKQGVDPTGLSPTSNRPEYIQLQNLLKTTNLALSGDNEKNRLLSLTKKHIDSPSFSPNVYTYLGGPGAGTLTGGVGKTSIRFADQRTGINNSRANTREFNQGKPYTAESNLIKITGYGVSSIYGITLEQNNISEGDGLRTEVKSATDKFYTEKRDTSIDRNSVLNLPNEAPLNSDGTLNPNFDPTSVKDIPTIAGEYSTQYPDSQPFDNFIPNPDTQNKQGYVATLSQEELNAAADETRNTSTVIDFRRRVKKNKSPEAIKDGSLAASMGVYQEKRIETRVRLGDPGNPGIDRSNYVAGGGSARTGVDKINALYLYKSNQPAKTDIINDLVKFRIATIDNDDPSKVTYAHFRAFINGISDSFGAEWDTFRYMGRGENFYNYQGFNRSMRLNWTVMAQSKEELSIMYQKLNYLASTLAPNYSAAGFMRGNIHRLTIGGYVYEYPGIIESLDFTIPDDTTWEIGIPVDPQQVSNTSGNVSSDSSVKELPHRIEVAMSFKPIDKFLPQTVKDINGAGTIQERFLSLQDAFKDNVNDLYNDGIPEWAKTKGE
jgi:hypothetical protein